MRHWTLCLLMLGAVCLWGCGEPPQEPTEPETPPAAGGAQASDPADATPTDATTAAEPETPEPLADPADIEAAKARVSELVGTYQTDEATGAIVEIDLMEIKAPVAYDDLVLFAKLDDLRELYVYGGGVTNEGLAELTKLENLERLGLEDCAIDDAGVKTISEIKSLKWLEMRKCAQTTDACLAYMQDLPKLTYLTVMYNLYGDQGLAHLSGLKLRLLDIRGITGMVTNAGMESIAKIESLVDLKLRNLFIVDAYGFEQLASLKNIRSLEIQDAMQLNNDALIFLETMPGIEQLNIMRGYVDDEGLAHMAGLKKLKRLYLRGLDGLSGSGFVHIQGAKDLWLLDVSETIVNDEGLAHLAGLEKIKWLNLWHTRVSDQAIEETISKWTALEYLNLQGVGYDDAWVTDAGVAILAKLPNLKELNLSENGEKITDQSLESLKDCPSLKKLDVRYTAVTDEGVAAFQAARPDVTLAGDAAE